jgi:adenylate kinase
MRPADNRRSEPRFAAQLPGGTLRLVLLGAPGSGKGTQAIRLAEATGARHISTGDLLRAEVAADTDLGGRVAGYLDAGELVPDDILLDLTLPLIELAAADSGYLLDGFPRSVEQASELAERISEPAAVNRVVFLSVPRAELVARLLRRAAEQGRSDDTAEVIERRLQVFEDEISSLIDHYRRAGLLATVDGHAGPAEVHRRLLAALRNDT